MRLQCKHCVKRTNERMMWWLFTSLCVRCRCVNNLCIIIIIMRDLTQNTRHINSRQIQFETCQFSWNMKSTTIFTSQLDCQLIARARTLCTVFCVHSKFTFRFGSPNAIWNILLLLSAPFWPSKSLVCESAIDYCRRSVCVCVWSCVVSFQWKRSFFWRKCESFGHWCEFVNTSARQVNENYTK